MWIFTKHGFISVVEAPNDPDKFVIRARRREDLEAVQKAAGLFVPIMRDDSRDYAYRCFMGRAAWAGAIARITHGIDYRNFKHSIQGDYEYSDALYDIWARMRELQRRQRG